MRLTAAADGAGMDLLRARSQPTPDDGFPEAQDYDTAYLSAGLDPVLHPCWPTRVDGAGVIGGNATPPVWWRRQLARVRGWLRREPAPRAAG